jgi:lysine-N-methylase
VAALEREMEIIERYQPEFVLRHAARSEACSCPACSRASEGWPQANVKLTTQLRESLDPGCESVARELLFNPQAFELQISQAEVQGTVELTAWDEMLNQQCINLAVHPALSLEVSLYAIGVLLSKAQQYLVDDKRDPALLMSMGEQLAQLAEHGVLEEQLTMLPVIKEHRLAALKEMGAMRLNLNLPMADKMSMMLKLSELNIMQPNRLSERLQELQQNMAKCQVLTEQPHILRNVLIYRLYQNVFPGIKCENYGLAFQALTRQFFQLKMLFAVWVADRQMLSDGEIVTLFSAWFGWDGNCPQAEAAAVSSDFSLLVGLSLLIDRP